MEKDADGNFGGRIYFESDMDLKLITGNIKSRLGIAELNDMQKAAAVEKLPATLLMLAPTGSGKTLAFALPFLRSLHGPDGKVQGLVLAPSRELVLQIFNIIRPIATGHKTVALYGGHTMNVEASSLSVTPDIIIATPGRLLDHIRRGQLSLSDASALVIDEYDKCLELGFHDEMRRIAGRLKSLRTVILTSATKLNGLPGFLDMSALKTLDFTKGNTDTAAPKLDIKRVESPSRDKIDILESLLRTVASSDTKTLVFVNHRESAERVFKLLKTAGFPIGMYHGGLEQPDRERALLMFNNGSTPILVSTDLGARGLDIADVKSIIHYHLPLTSENWIHRNGRTGRMGSEGDVYVIVSEADSVPDFVKTGHNYMPPYDGVIPEPKWSTLHINAGKKEKISRGDIAGFLIQKGGLGKDEVGVIDVKDHSSYVAVPRGKARDTIKVLEPYKIKNTRVRITQVHP